MKLELKLKLELELELELKVNLDDFPEGDYVQHETVSLSIEHGNLSLRESKGFVIIYLFLLEQCFLYYAKYE